MQMISINEKPSDVIGLSTPNVRPSPALAHYYHGSAPIHLIGSSPVPDKSAVERVLQSLPPIKSRLWLIFRSPIKERLQMIHTVVKEQFRIQQHWAFSGIDLFLVKREASSDLQGPS